MLNEYIPGTAEHLDRQLRKEFLDDANGGPSNTHAIAEIQQRMAGQRRLMELEDFLRGLADKSPEVELPRYTMKPPGTSTEASMYRDVIGRYLVGVALRP